jgi:hypothetical protein
MCRNILKRGAIRSASFQRSKQKKKSGKSQINLLPYPKTEEEEKSKQATN